MAAYYRVYTNPNISDDTFTFFINVQVVLDQKPVGLLPETMEECQAELDIIRGRVPTPKGYSVSKDRAKALMAKIKQLQ